MTAVLKRDKRGKHTQKRQERDVKMEAETGGCGHKEKGCQQTPEL